MKVKALLLGFIIASAPGFLPSIIKTANIFAQEEIRKSVETSPLQPAATISAQELEKIEDLEIPLEVGEQPGGSQARLPFKAKPFAFQIFGIKILPLILALVAMAALGSILNRLTKTFRGVKHSERKNRSGFIEAAEKIEPREKVKRRERGRPPKRSKEKPAQKRPRGRPRKMAQPS